MRHWATVLLIGNLSILSYLHFFYISKITWMPDHHIPRNLPEWMYMITLFVYGAILGGIPIIERATVGFFSPTYAELDTLLTAHDIALGMTGIFWIGMVINRFTKISVHSAAMAGCTAVLIVFSPVVGWGMVLATVITGWARMVLKAHTVGQVVLGYLVASSSVMIAFRFFGLI